MLVTGDYERYEDALYHIKGLLDNVQTKLFRAALKRTVSREAKVTALALLRNAIDEIERL